MTRDGHGSVTPIPAGEAAVYQRIRSMHCDDELPGHDCQGRVIIDRHGVTLSCPRCGDARRVYCAQEAAA